MTVETLEALPLQSEENVVRARQAARAQAVKMAFKLIDQTKIVTAVSELARNTVIYGGGGEMQMAMLDRNGQRGLQLVFKDQGPGIPDIAQALTDGYTTGSGLGLGLGGAKRLMDSFDIVSHPGKGTRITIIKWMAAGY